MKTNQDVVKSFLNGKIAKSLSMTSTGDKLYSYNTIIAQWHNNELIVNKTKYSRTTSVHHQSKLFNEVRSYTNVVYVGGNKTDNYVPFNSHDLKIYVTKS